VFASSRAIGRIPVLAILGVPGSGKTTFLRRLLNAPGLAHSVVIMAGAAQGEALDYPRIEHIPALEDISDAGCLCCGLRSGLGDALRGIFLAALSRRHAQVDRVIIEAGCTNPAPLKLALRHTPFLGQRYVYRTTFLVLDAERLTRCALDLSDSGLQYADVVVLSKSDLIPPQAQQRLILAVKQLNSRLKIILSTEGVEALLSNTLH
jgi:G3E family GTPase